MWSYEIVGNNEEVLESSEAVYASAFEAQMAARARIKENLNLLGPMAQRGQDESRRPPNGCQPRSEDQRPVRGQRISLLAATTISTTPISTGNGVTVGPRPPCINV